MIPNEILLILVGLNGIFEESVRIPEAGFRIREGLRSNPTYSSRIERNLRRILLASLDSAKVSLRLWFKTM
jgi:hypothetical protein